MATWKLQSIAIGAEERTYLLTLVCPSTNEIREFMVDVEPGTIEVVQQRADFSEFLKDQRLRYVDTIPLMRAVGAFHEACKTVLRAS